MGVEIDSHPTKIPLLLGNPSPWWELMVDTSRITVLVERHILDINFTVIIMYTDQLLLDRKKSPGTGAFVFLFFFPGFNGPVCF